MATPGSAAAVARPHCQKSENPAQMLCVTIRGKESPPCFFFEDFIMDFKQLSKLREQIDAVDTELLALFNRRASLSLEVGRLKAGTAPVFDPRRENELLDSLRLRNPGPLPEAHLRAIWREILSSSRALQRPPRVAYLGPEGTFSFFAGLEYLGHATLFEPCTDLHEVFHKVCNGTCDLGVVPLENSLQGTVGQSFDLFFKFDVVIKAEFSSRISHCLLSNADALSEVRTVYSHPQPLGQCGDWLRGHLPWSALVPVESTAAAAHRAAAEPGTAAIGQRRLADMTGLSLLAANIEDAPNNRTRFVLIAPRSGSGDATPTRPEHTVPQLAGPKAVKSSLLLTLPDRAGALSTVLNLLAENNINMRKVESRPMAGQRAEPRSMAGECWKYIFFVDVECDLLDAVYAPLVEHLRRTCTTFRILGSYPAAPDSAACAEE